MRSPLPIACLALYVMSLHACATLGAEPPTTIDIERGDLAVRFRGNEQSPRVLSGIDSLIHTRHAPHFDAFDPDDEGASAGLNFEHIISGHPTPNNRFTPRHGRYSLFPLSDGNSVVLVRRANDSPWKIDSTLVYRVVPPHYIDFEFRCTPRDATLFGRHGYALFFFANYMNDVARVPLHFRGTAEPNGAERWIEADAPPGHTDWNQGGNYRAVDATPLPYDAETEFRLNTWSYDWPRISQPFYYGLADQGMVFMLMFDRLVTDRDETRFSLYKFKLANGTRRPAWDFQYVIRQVETNERYHLRGRLVWKPFVSAGDCQCEYDTWKRQHVDAYVARQDELDRSFRKRGFTTFRHDGEIVEVIASGNALRGHRNATDWRMSRPY